MLTYAATGDTAVTTVASAPTATNSTSGLVLWMVVSLAAVGIAAYFINKK